MHKSLSAIGVLALVFALIAPIALHGGNRFGASQPHRSPPPRSRPRPYCADLDQPRPNPPARRATPFPRITRITVVSRRAAAAMPRVRKVTIIGRITAGAIPSLGSPLSAPAPVASTTPPVFAASPAERFPWPSGFPWPGGFPQPGGLPQPSGFPRPGQIWRFRRRAGHMGGFGHR